MSITETTCLSSQVTTTPFAVGKTILSMHQLLPKLTHFISQQITNITSFSYKLNIGVFMEIQIGGKLKVINNLNNYVDNFN